MEYAILCSSALISFLKGALPRGQGWSFLLTLFHDFFKVGVRAELGYTFRRNRELFPSCDVSAYFGFSLFRLKNTEATQKNALAIGHATLNDFHKIFYDRKHHLGAQISLVRD